MLDPRNPLIKNVTNNLFPFDKDSLPSAYVLGKILSGITQDALNLDTCVKAGVYRFNTNFTSPASEEIPFAGQSGFIVVHGINPTEEPNTSAFANENRIRQVVYIDGLEAEGYTRTGIGTDKVGEGDEATYTWQWSPEWKSLTSAEVPSATIGMRYKNDNDQYVYNLNLYIKSGCWIVGKPAPPSPTQWTNFPTNITSTEQHGYLVVYTEDSEDVTIGNAPTYFQIWYPINLYDRTPFIRSKKYNSSTWESWRRVGAEAIQQEAVARAEADNNILSVTESKIATKEPRTITMDVRTARVPGNIYYDSDEDPSVCQPYTEDEELPDESNLYIGTYKKCNLAHYNLRIHCHRTSIGGITYGSTPEEPQVVCLPSPLTLELIKGTLRDDVLIDVFLYTDCYLLFKIYYYTYDNQFVTGDIESFYHTKDVLLLRIMLSNVSPLLPSWALQVTK